MKFQPLKFLHEIFYNSQFRKYNCNSTHSYNRKSELIFLLTLYFRREYDQTIKKLSQKFKDVSKLSTCRVFQKKKSKQKETYRNLFNLQVTGATETWKFRSTRNKFQYGISYLELPSIHECKYGCQYGCKYGSFFCFQNSVPEQV